MIVVDRTRMPFLKEGESLYMERIRKYAPLEWVEVRPARAAKKRPEEEILNEEGRNLLRKVMPHDYLVALDRRGQHFGSEELAHWLAQLSGKGVERITLVVGGALGLSKEVFGRSREVLALSRLTLTHEMSRLVLLEQLYRALTILRGERYHK